MGEPCSLICFPTVPRKRCSVSHFPQSLGIGNTFNFKYFNITFKYSFFFSPKVDKCHNSETYINSPFGMFPIWFFTTFLFVYEVFCNMCEIISPRIYKENILLKLMKNTFINLKFILESSFEFEHAWIKHVKELHHHRTLAPEDMLFSPAVASPHTRTWIWSETVMGFY